MVARYEEPHCPECGHMFKLKSHEGGKYIRYKDYEALLATIQGGTVIMKRGDPIPVILPA